MYTYKTTTKLHQADAAGIVFFVNYFTLAHDAYEAFMESIGYNFNYIIKQTDMLLLIGHAEADYIQSLSPGEKIQVNVKAGKIGHSSYTLNYEIFDSENELACRLKTTHVAIDKKGSKIELPDRLRTELEAIK